MRFRLGFVSGFAAGYYLGAKAGRQRYEQINQTLEKLRRSEALEEATDRARGVIDDSVDKVKDVLERRSGTPDGAADGTTTTPAQPSDTSATSASTYAPYAADTPGTS
jgi:hypothetical protein